MCGLFTLALTRVRLSISSNAVTDTVDAYSSSSCHSWLGSRMSGLRTPFPLIDLGAMRQSSLRLHTLIRVKNTWHCIDVGSLHWPHCFDTRAICFFRTLSDAYLSAHLHLRAVALTAYLWSSWVCTKPPLKHDWRGVFWSMVCICNRFSRFFVCERVRRLWMSSRSTRSIRDVVGKR